MTLFQRKAQSSLQVFFPALTEEDFLALYDQLFQGGQYEEAGESPPPHPGFLSGRGGLLRHLAGRRVRPDPCDGGGPGAAGPMAGRRGGDCGRDLPLVRGCPADPPHPPRRKEMTAMKEYHAGGLAALSHPPGGQVPEFLEGPGHPRAWNFHHTLAEYAPTPLVGLAGLARELGVGAVFVKDESHRFGLNAFKGLGDLRPHQDHRPGTGSGGEFDLRPALRPGVPGEGAGHGVRHHHRRQPRPGRGLGRPQAGVPGPRVSPRRLFLPPGPRPFWTWGPPRPPFWTWAMTMPSATPPGWPGKRAGT